jgi:hypothetical protein
LWDGRARWNTAGMVGRSALAVGVVLLAGAAAAPARPQAALPCAPAPAGPAYAAAVNAALGAKQDVWGNQLLAAPGGPTYRSAAQFLHPLMLVGPPWGSAPGRLTVTGVYYLAFGRPAQGPHPRELDLHVADGSQIISEHSNGPRLSIRVGAHTLERYGSCLGRLSAPELGGGYLPILDTSYVDAAGVHYQQESFATRIPQTRSLVSFVQLTIGPHGRARLTPSNPKLLLAGPGGRLAGHSVVYSAGARPRTVYAAWLADRAVVRPLRLNRKTYYKARRALAAYWNRRLASGASFVVPEKRVYNAERNLLIQNLVHSWRYSLGNPYERFSWELIDDAEVMGAYGFTGTERSILERSFRSTTVFPTRAEGEQMIGTADYYRRTGDAAFVEEVTPALAADLNEFAFELDNDGSGLLYREPFGVDISTLVYGLHGQSLAYQGLRAIAAVWTGTGHADLAAQATQLADRLGSGLRSAVAASEHWLPDGSLFIPVSLLDPTQQPFDPLTASRDGSYWNLVMPYALESGLFPPGSTQANAVLDYLLGHGSRLLGLVRFRAFGESGKPGYRSPGSDDVYGINVSRFLADEGQADQLVLSLYGKLAASMTQNTFVSGEGSTIGPVDGEFYRSMFRPPNAPNNAFFLETLRLMLVHETRDALGSPSGLELAYSTPRTWLAAGKRIVVRKTRTSFGSLSYRLEASAGSVHAVVDVPARVPPTTLKLRLRLPGGERIAAVTLGGKAFDRFAPATGTIDLSGLSGRLDLTVAVS